MRTETAGLEIVEGSVATCPDGFAAAGATCGLKESGKSDLALLCATGTNGAAAAGVFTKNLVVAAPVTIAREHLRTSQGRIKAVLINSGCANAATGAKGHERALRTVRAAADACNCNPEEVLLASTGVIGVQLEHQRIENALPALAESIGVDGIPAFAEAIRTTDAYPKTAETSFTHEGTTFRVVGIAKGAGMIHPNMATMLATLLVDAEVEPAELDGMLRTAVDGSFHRISVDGDTSTNDAVFALASGAAGPAPKAQLQEAMNAVARALAMQIVRDGEGATRVLRVTVRKAATEADALQVAKTVASSLLVRTAVAGKDPNWGRILAAAGRSGVHFDPNCATLLACGTNRDGSNPQEPVALFADGAPTDEPLAHKQAAFAADTVDLELLLDQGVAEADFISCDLNEAYVRFNSAYTT